MHNSNIKKIPSCHCERSEAILMDTSAELVLRDCFGYLRQPLNDRLFECVMSTGEEFRSSQ